jgi:cytoskeletal protein RodZ
LPPFGDSLKKEREKRGITLEDVALTTKIGKRFLRAMEEEHFEQLPGGIFNKGFVRAYARCIGIDEDQTVADYLLASGEVLPKKVEAEPVPIPTVKAPSQKAAAAKAGNPKEVLAEKVRVREKEKVRQKEKVRERAEESPREDGSGSNFLWVAVASLLVVAALVLAIWHFVSRGSTRGPTDRSTVGPTPGSAAGVPAPGASARVPKASPPVPERGGLRNAPAPVSPTPVKSSSPAAGSFVVLIRASEESWISIQVDDKPAFEVTLETSEQQSIEAHNKIEIKIGNLAGTDLWFNGQKLALPGEEGEVRSLSFDAQGLRPQESKPRGASSPGPSP